MGSRLCRLGIHAWRYAGADGRDMHCARCEATTEPIPTKTRPPWPPDAKQGAVIWLVVALLVVLTLAGVIGDDDDGQNCHPDAVDCGYDPGDYYPR